MSLWRNITGMLASSLSRNETPTSAEEAIQMAQDQMAYGRYADAERMLLTASQRDPQKTELRVGLAELYFIWGNAGKFLEVATQLRANPAFASEWPRIFVMGRQLCPSESLFR